MNQEDQGDVSPIQLLRTAIDDPSVLINMVGPTGRDGNNDEAHEAGTRFVQQLFRNVSPEERNIWLDQLNDLLAQARRDQSRRKRKTFRLEWWYKIPFPIINFKRLYQKIDFTVLLMVFTMITRYLIIIMRVLTFMVVIGPYLYHLFNVFATLFNLVSFSSNFASDVSSFCARGRPALLELRTKMFISGNESAISWIYYLIDNNEIPSLISWNFIKLVYNSLEASLLPVTCLSDGIHASCYLSESSLIYKFSDVIVEHFNIPADSYWVHPLTMIVYLTYLFSAFWLCSTILTMVTYSMRVKLSKYVGFAKNLINLIIN
ncbi:hypothetical protein CAAN1_29S00474 [[Candida] anglica]|uniref:Uncharacterized protein n=1 Tax=[Candida] anglica TaxID=148631 RepID=A0ABP0EEG4_9ASCO